MESKKYEQLFDEILLMETPINSTYSMDDIFNYSNDCKIVIKLLKILEYATIPIQYFIYIIQCDQSTLINTHEVYEQYRNITINIKIKIDESVIIHLASEYNIALILDYYDNLVTDEWLKYKIYLHAKFNYVELSLKYPKDKILIRSENLSVLYSSGYNEFNLFSEEKNQLIVDNDFASKFDKYTMDWMEQHIKCDKQHLKDKYNLILYFINTYDYDLLSRFTKLYDIVFIDLQKKEIISDIEKLADWADTNNITVCLDIFNCINKSRRSLLYDDLLDLT